MAHLRSLLALLTFFLSSTVLVASAAHLRRDVSPFGRHHMVKRASNGRCKPRPSSSSVVVSATPANLVKVTTTNEPTPEPTTTKPATTKAETTPPPAPTTTKVVIQEPEPTTTKASSGGGGGSAVDNFMAGTNYGQGTFYKTGLGACGITNNDGDYIAAVSHLMFDTYPGYSGENPNNNPMCGRKVKASRNGKSVIVALTDRCEGCAKPDLDFSPAAFNQLASPSEGRVEITWEWV